MKAALNSREKRHKVKGKETQGYMLNTCYMLVELMLVECRIQIANRSGSDCKNHAHRPALENMP